LANGLRKLAGDCSNIDSVTDEPASLRRPFAKTPVFAWILV